VDAELDVAGEPVEWPPGSLMADLPEPARATMIKLGVARRYRAGEVILFEGDHSTHVVLLVTGYVKVTARLPGEGEALLAIRAAGDTVGEMAALDGEPRSATVTAAVPVDARVIPEEAFRRFRAEDSAVLSAVDKTLTKRWRSATRRRVDYTGCGVKVRLARVLAEFARSYGVDLPGGGRRIGVPLSQSELAAAVGAAVPTVHNALRHWRTTGVIATGYRYITICNEDLFRRIAWPEGDTRY
jgi:CRP-like cAMP-binding protein